VCVCVCLCVLLGSVEGHKEGTDGHIQDRGEEYDTGAETWSLSSTGRSCRLKLLTCQKIVNLLQLSTALSF